MPDLSAPPATPPFELKRLHKDAIGKALDKAQRYRLLNEPTEAESICLDILEIEPGHQEALVTLLLAITDQFQDGLGDRLERAQALLVRLREEYARAYYAGVIAERRGKAVMGQHTLSAGHDAYEYLVEAMHCYERAEALAPPDNDDARLRYNACVRKIRNASHLEPRQTEPDDPYLEE
jgi:hypothetical protein